MHLRDIDPAQLGQQAHNLVVDRIRDLATAIDPVRGYEVAAHPALTDGPSEVRRCVALLAHYARTGEPPEGRPELVHEYLVSLIPSGLLPDELDPDDAPEEGASETEQAVHLVVLAVLARERLRDGMGVPTAWLAALAGTQPSCVRRLVSTGELRTWRRGVEQRGRQTRTHVHPEDARRWLEGRRAS